MNAPGKGSSTAVHHTFRSPRASDHRLANDDKLVIPLILEYR
jgi:hypothetical protein